VSSVELTRLYLARLRQYDPALHCVITYTEELALRQAAQADREIAAGRYRGPLHGVPWGAKDLIAYPGYPTTWGAGPYKEQMLDVKATAARKLEEAGAVLVAKLSLGALAWDDVWFGGRTRNPWAPRQGSSGSSAGSASATAAGLVGFAPGSETLGHGGLHRDRLVLVRLGAPRGLVPRIGDQVLGPPGDPVQWAAITAGSNFSIGVAGLLQRQLLGQRDDTVQHGVELLQAIQVELGQLHG